MDLEVNLSPSNSLSRNWEYTSSVAKAERTSGVPGGWPDLREGDMGILARGALIKE